MLENVIKYNGTQIDGKKKKYINSVTLSINHLSSPTILGANRSRMVLNVCGRVTFYIYYRIYVAIYRI